MITLCPKYLKEGLFYPEADECHKKSVFGAVGLDSVGIRATESLGNKRD